MPVNAANALDKRRSLLHETRCQNCSLSSLCLPLALELEDMEQFDAIIKRRAPLKKGESLFRQGSTFNSVFAVRAGSLKQVTTEGSGPGHSICPATRRHRRTIPVIALETTTVCEIPFDRLDSLSEKLPELRGQLYRSMSKELRDDRKMMRLLSRKTADQRLASFFTSLSERFRRRGYSPYSFRLSMSRADIGNYLGLAVETVSRILGRFQQQGLVEVSGREVNILNLEELVAQAEETS